MSDADWTVRTRAGQTHKVRHKQVCRAAVLDGRAFDVWTGRVEFSNGDVAVHSDTQQKGPSDE